MERRLRVSVLELPARWDAHAEALAEVDELLARRETDLAVLPEQCLGGYISPTLETDLRPFAQPLDGPHVRAFAALARKHRTHLVAPLVLAEEGRAYNAAVVLGREGELLATYKKRHPWIPERWATPGEAPHPVILVDDVRVTLAICYDVHFLADEAERELDLAELLVFTSAWVDKDDTRLPALEALARRFSVAVANANWAPGVVVCPGMGESSIFDARGHLVAQVPSRDSHRARGAEPGTRADAELDFSTPKTWP